MFETDLDRYVVEYSYKAQNSDELTLVKDQVITVISKKIEDPGWWKGEINGKTGVFPNNFVKPYKVAVRLAISLLIFYYIEVSLIHELQFFERKRNK